MGSTNTQNTCTRDQNSLSRACNSTVAIYVITWRMKRDDTFPSLSLHEKCRSRNAAVRHVTCAAVVFHWAFLRVLRRFGGHRTCDKSYFLVLLKQFGMQATHDGDALYACLEDEGYIPLHGDPPQNGVGVAVSINAPPAELRGSTPPLAR